MSVEFGFLTKSLNAIENSTLVVFASTTGKDKKIITNLKSLSKEVLNSLSQIAADSPFKGNPNDVLFLRGNGFEKFKNLLLVGYGDAKKAGHEDIRKAAAIALKALKANGIFDSVLALESIPFSAKDKDAKITALFDGFYLADYSSDLFKSQRDEKTVKVKVATSTASLTNNAQKLQKQSAIVCECINFSRSLGDAPGNKMNPIILANETKKEAQGSALKVTIWDGARIKKEKMGCLHGVALGGGTDARFIIMEYKNGPKSQKPICYVGKGLTFDAGGICIKPAAGMDEMKFDMCGGANVIGTMLAIARLKLKVNAIGIVPSSENMLGPMANKPGDILTARNGKTVEVINTDAEGRLILSDALVYACEQDPQFIVDAATLTGAMVVALGDIHTGFFSRDEKLTQKIKKAAAQSGELIWEMPLHEEHYKDMKGSYADLQNVTPRKGAGSAHGAVFLAEFVDEKIPWAHFDIAGTAWNTGHRIPYTSGKGASGCMIRTFLELAKNV